jgi:hypothetical protein
VSAELVIPLTEDEAERLAKAEVIIARGLKGFVEVGQELIVVRDGRLYRSTHYTFESYCSERWGFPRKRADELIGAASTARAVTEISGIPPQTESQAKALRGLPTEQAAEVMAEAAESGKVTAASIRDARQRIAPRPEPQPSPESAQKLSDYLDADPDLRRREQARKFRQDLNRSWALQEWEPEFVAQILDDDDVVTIDHLILNLTSFRDQVRSARRTPLAVVKEMKR